MPNVAENSMYCVSTGPNDRDKIVFISKDEQNIITTNHNNAKANDGNNFLTPEGEVDFSCPCFEGISLFIYYCYRCDCSCLIQNIKNGNGFCIMAAVSRLMLAILCVIDALSKD